MSTDPNPNEFDPGIGHRQFGASATVFNGQLWVVGGDSDALGALAGTTLSLTVDLAGSAVTEPANWHTAPINPTEFDFAYTMARCATVPLAGDSPGLYLIWNQGSGLFAPSSVTECLWVSRYFDDGSSGAPAWHTPIQLVESDGVTAVKATTAAADVSATAWGTDTIIVACASVKTATTNGQTCLYLGVYNVTDLGEGDKTWRARWHTCLTASTFQSSNWGPLSNVQVKDVGHHVSIDWFSTGAEDPGSTSTPPPYYLSVFTSPDSSQLNGNPAYFLLPMTIDTNNSPVPQVPDPLRMYVFTQSATAPLVIRDPASQLVMYTTAETDDKKHWVLSFTYATSVAPGASDARSDAGDAPLPNDANAEGALPCSADSTPPTVAYFLDMNHPTSATVNGKAATNYPVWEFFFYGSRMKAQVYQYGTAQVIPNYATYQPCTTDPTTGPCEDTKYIITGIFDGPIPVPNQNIAGFQLESDHPGAGTMSYAFTQSDSRQHQVSFSLMAGFKSSGAFSKGLGPAWDISFSAGPGSVSGDLTSTSLTQQQDHPCLFNADLNRVATGIQPLGMLANCTASIEATAYRFYDQDGKLVSDATSMSDDPAPKNMLFEVTFTGSEPAAFTPYAVTPGNLDSYLPDTINATMQTLGYKGVDYFGDVIVPNAYTFPETGQKFMSFGWGTDGSSEGTFQATSSTFDEQSWSLQASDYLGVSGGAGASLLGEGEEMSWSLLAGVSISTNTQTTDTKGQQWGINLAGSPWGPMSWGGDDSDNPLYVDNRAAWLAGIAGYTFYLYFLPAPPPDSGLPSNAWTTELITYMPRVANQQFPDPSFIDSNSGAWRIFYVVTQYVTNEDYYVNRRPFTRQYMGPYS